MESEESEPAGRALWTLVGGGCQVWQPKDQDACRSSSRRPRAIIFRSGRTCSSPPTLSSNFKQAGLSSRGVSLPCRMYDTRWLSAASPALPAPLAFLRGLRFCVHSWTHMSLRLPRNSLYRVKMLSLIEATGRVAPEAFSYGSSILAFGFMSMRLGAPVLQCCSVASLV